MRNNHTICFMTESLEQPHSSPIHPSDKTRQMAFLTDPNSQRSQRSWIKNDHHHESNAVINYAYRYVIWINVKTNYTWMEYRPIYKSSVIGFYEAEIQMKLITWYRRLRVKRMFNPNYFIHRVTEQSLSTRSSKQIYAKQFDAIELILVLPWL